MTAQSPAQHAPGADAATTPWWRDAVVYQVYPRSFADADGDGMGDLPGITAHLPHLRDLGVDALWLSPFFTSPQRDGGYDVADYCDVDPRFGSLADADELIASAHAMGLKVIVDIVPNHSSSEHELFQQALAAGPGSPERDMYVFADGRGEHGELPPNNWTSIFHGEAWTRITEADGTPGQWYLHIFDTSQPDWNWQNPRVHALFRDVLRFWLDRGADGFRVDVAHGMVKPEGLPDAAVNAEGLLDIPEGEVPIYFDNDGVLEIYREWRPILDSYEGERMMVLEAWIPEHRLPLYIGPEEAHQSFNFGFLQATWGVETMRAAIEKPLALADAVGAPTTWVLSNHDVIRHATRYGFPPGYRFGEGLGRAETPDAALGLARARAATLLMLSLPGAAYLYQGEELGLPEVAEIPDALREDPAHLRAGVPGRDGCRVPLPWRADAPAYGFSPTGESWLPQPEEFGALAADAQEGVPGSTLEMYRAAIALRREHGLGRPDAPVEFLEDLPEGLLGLVRGEVVVLVNTSEQELPLPAGPDGLDLADAEVLVGSAEPVPGRLPADAAVWLRRR
ncbi:glycoside hydrolase family 13 protein [Brachybacterium saurashtrense]|uniref:Alpha-amylase n=1 Tax=Brachybacterium saurashtrense TaxID=556288 RepID=A0A345YLG4_9MICO|nr:alpha-amylase family glycosyl hydrolase [Brachybacterium saurashtrense]AXK44766.1 alpha-amylase [Brachybacterium saurashtrense]RRR23378.1 alpha-amylase [Brachybacterium saurashtrense]